MTTIINHDLRVVNGKTIYMPPWYGGGVEFGNLDLPDVYTLDTTQKYPLGTIFRDGIRTFIYTYIDQGGWTLTNNFGGYFCKTNATLKELTDALITGASGASTVELNYGASACAANKYAGGLMGIKGPSDGVRGSRSIISNLVKDSDNYVVFTIDGTLPEALTTSDDFSLIENPYASVRSYTSESTADLEESAMYVGGLVVTMVDARYMWVQTWGPFFMIGINESFEGDEAPQQGVTAYHGSGNRHPSYANAIAQLGMYTGALQQVGWALPHNAAVSSIGEMIFLTIHP